MKKETQIIATVEITEIMPNFSFTGSTIEEVKEQAKEGLKARFEGLGFDNINITNVQVFEIEKEERRSTEDLINIAKMCAIGDGRYCSSCPCNYGDLDCTNHLIGVIADRLEELHNQQTATPIEREDIERNCLNCAYFDVSEDDEPCKSCVKYFTKFEIAKR